MTPLLSVIIATKNREKYCISAIENILKMKDDNIELVVQDNSDTDDLKKWVKENVYDPRFRYNYIPPPFSSISNFNAALELATGEYVCLIGDDDTIMPYIMPVVQWAKGNDIDSLCPKSFIEYYWPNALPKYPGGLLQIPENYNNSFSEINALSQLEQFISNGALDYMKYSLPKIYHGIVKKNCMDVIREKTGHYFGGLSPDIYAATALSLIVKKHIVLNYPLTIAGVCGKSTTAESAQGKHSGRYEETPHLRDKNDYVWNKRIPKFYSVETIWAETSLKAISEMGAMSVLDLFNYPKFSSAALLRNRHISEIVRSAIKQQTENLPWDEETKLYLQMHFFYHYHLARKVGGKIFRSITRINPKSSSLRYLDLKTIDDAVSISLEILEKTPLKL